MTFDNSLNFNTSIGLEGPPRFILKNCQTFQLFFGNYLAFIITIKTICHQSSTYLLRTIMSILTYADLPSAALETLLSKYGLTIVLIDGAKPIPGSFWGDSEAGLVGHQLYLRPDTPIHSALHEASHYVCMDSTRRQTLHTDAGGDYQEENAVCYLQLLLADYLPMMDRTRMWNEMDAWGYSFRLGSSQRWFEQDAQDAREWLLAYQLIDNDNQPTWRLRQE